MGGLGGGSGWSGWIGLKTGRPDALAVSFPLVSHTDWATFLGLSPGLLSAFGVDSPGLSPAGSGLLSVFAAWLLRLGLGLG